MEWLDDVIDREACLAQHATAPQEAFARKSGWVLRYAKSHRKWVKRWAVFDTKLQTFTFFKSPSKRERQSHSKKWQAPHIVKAASLLKHRLITDGSKFCGLSVELTSGKQMTLCFATAAERLEWNDFLTASLSSKVTLQELYDVHYQCVVGRGAFADVVLGLDRSSGEPVAVKMVTKAACRKHFDLMDREAQVMSMFTNHPHLLGLRHAFYSEEHIFIVSDLLEGGDLMRAMHNPDAKLKASFCENKAREVFKQVLFAVEWMHELGINHCDIKPQNIIRESDTHVRLTDFNSAAFCDEATEPGGTPEYMAPELACLECDDHDSGWDSSLDMWALGVLLFWMLCGYTPFHADSVPAVLQNVQNARFEFPKELSLSSDVKDLISSLLQIDPRLRPSAKEALQHSWVQREGTLKPLLTIMADARALLPALGLGAEVTPEPVVVPCSAIDNATLAAMHASTPSHLCIRVPRKGNSISYGFAASTTKVIEPEEVDLAMELSGLEVSDSLLSFDCPTPSDLVSPGSLDPMDSCTSMHRELSSFRSPGSAVLPKTIQEASTDILERSPIA